MLLTQDSAAAFHQIEIHIQIKMCSLLTNVVQIIAITREEQVYNICEPIPIPFSSTENVDSSVRSPATA